MTINVISSAIAPPTTQRRAFLRCLFQVVHRHQRDEHALGIDLRPRGAHVQLRREGPVQAFEVALCDRDFQSSQDGAIGQGCIDQVPGAEHGDVLAGWPSCSAAAGSVVPTTITPEVP